MSGPRITVRIERLRLQGPREDAAALAEALRRELAAQLAADPGLAGQGADRLRLSLPAGHGPAVQGRRIGQRIAGALRAPDGGV